MAKRKLDNLTRCAIAADEAGMSYGNYMAMHSYAPPELEPKEPQEDIPARVCNHCGKVFSMEGRSHNSRYCGPECQSAHGQKKYMEKYYARRSAERAKALGEQ